MIIIIIITELFNVITWLASIAYSINDLIAFHLIRAAILFNLPKQIWIDNQPRDWG